MRVSEQFTRVLGNDEAERLFGANDIEAMFPEGRGLSHVPWRQAGKRKSQQSYDTDLVHEELSQPVRGTHGLVEVDPRVLLATQPAVTRQGVEHYLGDDYERTGRTFAEQNNVGNRYPFVYGRRGEQNDTTEELLLSGHHRAAAALLQGRPLLARRVEGPWGRRRS